MAGEEEMMQPTLSRKKGRAKSGDSLLVMMRNACSLDGEEKFNSPGWGRADSFDVQDSAAAATETPSCSRDLTDELLKEEAAMPDDMQTSPANKQEVVLQGPKSGDLYPEPEEAFVQKRERTRSRIATLGLEMLTKIKVNLDLHLEDDCQTTPAGWYENGPERNMFFPDGRDKPSPEEKEEQRQRAIRRMERMASKLRTRAGEQAQKRKSSKKFSTCPHMTRAADLPSDSEVGDQRVDSKESSAPAEPSSSPLCALEEVERANPVIIFDWDDTLLPTWYISQVVNADSPPSTWGKLPEDSEFAASLTAHGRVVRETLEAARSVARVAIVTLGCRGWVDNSSDWFLPGANILELLQELDIPVYYAREFVSSRDKRCARVEEGVDLYMIAKRNAMLKCLRKIHRGQPCWQRKAHVISIGDSTVELEAIKEIMWDGCDSVNLVKAIKLMDEPSIDVLGMQLRLLMSWFPKVIAYQEDAYISMDSSPSMSELVKTLMSSDVAERGDDSP